MRFKENIDVNLNPKLKWCPRPDCNGYVEKKNSNKVTLVDWWYALAVDNPGMGWSLVWGQWIRSSLIGLQSKGMWVTAQSVKSESKRMKDVIIWLADNASMNGAGFVEGSILSLIMKATMF